MALLYTYTVNPHCDCSFIQLWSSAIQTREMSSGMHVCRRTNNLATPLRTSYQVTLGKGKRETSERVGPVYIFSGPDRFTLIINVRIGSIYYFLPPTRHGSILFIFSYGYLSTSTNEPGYS
jgi:hypothetical protein